MKKHRNPFYRRNIVRNAKLYLYSWWGGIPNKKPPKSPFLRNIYKNFYVFREIFRFYFLRQITIPRIEFVLTSKCSLKCKYCSNYIPLVKNKYEYTLEEFKNNIDVLTRVSRINTLLLLGGEPLILKNLHEYVEYIAQNSKINDIYIVTNCTIMPDEKLLEIIKKYNNKVKFYLSNYTANNDLSKILKLDEISEILDKYEIKYKTFKDLEWDMCYPLVHYNRSIDKNKEVFDICNTDCNSIALSKMYICPVASTLGIDNMQEFSSNEMVELSKERNLKEVKKDLISFYSVNYSSACDFCNKILGKKVTIPPAEQFTGEELKNRG